MDRSLRTVAGLVVASGAPLIYLFYAGILPSYLVPTALVALVSAVLFVYVREHHEFRGRNDYRRLATAGLVVAFAGAILWGVVQTVNEPDVALGSPVPAAPTVPESFLPEWWVLLVLGPAAVTLAVSAFRTGEFPEYATPENLEELPDSPVFFGAVTGFLGFWGVLFVGLGVVHRVVVVAPIFEELLKFGVALLFAAAVFGRSLPARYAVGVIVGALFGMVEHSITYPGEPDVSYLFRVLFHAAMTGLSLTAYTVFEELGDRPSMWISPVLAILLHFSHNTFVVVSALVLYSLAEQTLTTLHLTVGAIVVVVGVGATFLTARRNSRIVLFYDWMSSFSPAHGT